MKNQSLKGIAAGSIIGLIGLFLSMHSLSLSSRESAESVLEAVRTYRINHRTEILREYFAFLSLPNVFSDSENLRKNAAFIVQALEKRGIHVDILEVPGSPPAVFGEIIRPEATQTVAFYAHYDGQPVEPAEWKTDPWEPVLADRTWENGGRILPLNALPPESDKEWRIYARSASDDKAPIMAMLAALDGLQSIPSLPSVNIKFLFEGEEESGSKHLPEILEVFAPRLKADAWIFCDGPVHQNGRKLVYFGARGVVGLEMTLYGARRPLHSGHYGNWAPNPAVLLSHLVAGMRDTEGGIHIEGFWEDVRPLTEEDKQALAAIPNIDPEIRNELGLAWSEGEGALLVERIMRPALNLRGIRSGHVEDKAQNAIPTEAKASIDFRLVPDQNPEKIQADVERHLRKKGFTIVSEVPDQETRLAFKKIMKLDWEPGYPSARTSMALPFCRRFLTIMEESVEGAVVRMPTAGGSIPLYLFKKTPETPVVLLPVVNYDNNQHGADENLRLQNLWDAIEIFAGIFSRL